MFAGSRVPSILFPPFNFYLSEGAGTSGSDGILEIQQFFEGKLKTDRDRAAVSHRDLTITLFQHYYSYVLWNKYGGMPWNT